MHDPWRSLVLFTQAYPQDKPGKAWATLSNASKKRELYIHRTKMAEVLRLQDIANYQSQPRLPPDYNVAQASKKNI